ncbi:DsbA family protein [Pendulispora albinea]|uniref:Thioredoxin domain-containing protein n=1 Tax=Pendulispora albinea TaxID=2741071 RepID=A0ABZ2M002_9BACT
MKAWLRCAVVMLLAGCGSAPYPASRPAQKAEAPKVSADAAPQTSENEGPIPIGPDDPVWGSRTAPVTIVEFADFQCPFCERAEQSLERLQAEYGPEKLRIVWKNFPLPFHADARVLAEAAQGVFATGGNDAFWKFHRAAYAGMKARSASDESRVGSSEIASWVNTAGVDGKRILAGLDKHTWGGKVERDMELAGNVHVDGTPAFFINGVKLEGARPTEAFREIIDAEAEKARAKVAAGTARDRVYLEMTAANYQAAKDESAEAADKDDPAKDKTIYKVPVGQSPVAGPATALVTLVEFSDFECPFCKRSEQTVKALSEKYKNDLRIVWKNHPLPFHKQAMPAAELAVEAHLQRGHSGFWTVHDKLFDRAPSLADAELESIAQDAKLDPKKVRSALASHRHKARIEADQYLADDVGANGTPTFFINGRKIVGAQPTPVFEAVIEQELARAREVLAKGVAPAKLYDELIKDGKVGAEPERKAIAPATDAPVRGNAAAKVTIVEFSDFECPYCQRASGTVEQILKDYGGRVKLVFRHMPLAFHPHAHLAAEAAAEAYRQKGSAGFFKMHDLLFANQKQLDRPALEGYAAQLGLDGARFSQSLDSHDHSAKIDADAKVATDAGISGTPSFIINGYYLSGAQPYRNFKRLIERALAETTAKPAGKAR